MQQSLVSFHILKSSFMSTLADKYYIKALDNYPYDLEISLENLNYALSSNRDHAGANHLMAQLHMDYLNDFRNAMHYLERALACEPENLNVCYSLITLFIKVREPEKANKLLKYAHKINGADPGILFTLKALNYEYQKQYVKALDLLIKALDEAYNDDETENIKSVMKRVNEKLGRNSKYNYISNFE